MISKDKVLDLLKYWKHLEAYDDIEDMEGVDVIECKDCIYARDRGSVPKSLWYCTEWRTVVDPLSYCFRAKEER